MSELEERAFIFGRDVGWNDALEHVAEPLAVALEHIRNAAGPAWRDGGPEVFGDIATMAEAALAEVKTVRG